MTTPPHLWHHDIPQIRNALEIAERLPKKNETDAEEQRIAYVIKRLND